MKNSYDIELFRRKAELCKTFSDPKRLMIISELRGGEKSVSDLVVALQVPQAVVSRHLAILRNRGVVVTRRDGVNIYYRLVDFKIIEACDIIHEILLDQAARNREIAERLIV
jgi:ArsR family transcriptional regulator